MTAEKTPPILAYLGEGSCRIELDTPEAARAAWRLLILDLHGQVMRVAKIIVQIAKALPLAEEDKEARGRLMGGLSLISGAYALGTLDDGPEKEIHRKPAQDLLHLRWSLIPWMANEDYPIERQLPSPSVHESVLDWAWGLKSSLKNGSNWWAESNSFLREKVAEIPVERLIEWLDEEALFACEPRELAQYSTTQALRSEIKKVLTTPEGELIGDVEDFLAFCPSRAERPRSVSDICRWARMSQEPTTSKWKVDSLEARRLDGRIRKTYKTPLLGARWICRKSRRF